LRAGVQLQKQAGGVDRVSLEIAAAGESRIEGELRKSAARKRAYPVKRNTTLELGITEEASVARKTATSYDKMLALFMVTMGIVTLVMAPEALDALVVGFFDTLYLEGKAPSSGEKLVSA